MKINKHIEIVRTDIKGLPSMSAKSALRAQAALSNHYQHVGIFVINNRSDLEQLVRNKPDLIFSGLTLLIFDRHSTETRDVVWLSDYLDQHAISYTGSQAAAMRFSVNKAKAKAVVQDAGVRTAQFFTARPNEHSAEEDLPLQFPLFVKPLDAGGGKGIGNDSVVRNFPAFQQKVKAIYEAYGSNSLVEQYLDGREFSVAILDNESHDDQWVMPIEIITEANEHGDRILGWQVKTEDNEQVILVGDESIRAQVCELAVAAYNSLGGRDLGRIDIRMDESGKAHFIEANFMPAPATRYFAGAFHVNKGTSYETTLLKIIGPGLRRSSNIPRVMPAALAPIATIFPVEPFVESLPLAS